MSGRVRTGWRRMWALGLLSLALVGCTFVPAAGALASERVPAVQRQATIRFDQLAVGFQQGGTLGFSLRDTAIDEQLYRRDQQGERGLMWSAQFQSRWDTNEDQLDRWSAQVIGLLADGVGPNVRLAGWERLDANDIGDRRVAYRYALATPEGERVGEATVVVFARGNEVGMTGTASVGERLPIDASALARALNAAAVGG